MNVRNQLAGVALLLACATLSTSSTRAADKILVRHAINTITAVNWPDFVAETKGFNDRRNINVQQFVVPAESIVAAVIAGSVDVGLANATQLVLSVDKGANIAAVGIGGANQPYHLMASPSVKAFADLKGKTLALADSVDIYDDVLRQIFKKHGLDMDKDLNVIYGNGSTQRYAAIASGAIQAGLFPPPLDADLASRGFTSLAYTPDYYPHLPISVNAVNRGWAAANADTLRRFLQARSDAIDWLNNPANQDEAIQILMDQTKVSKPAAQVAYDYYIKQKQFPHDGCIQTLGLDTLVHMLKETGRLAKLGANDAGKLIDRQWCPK